MEGGVGSRTDAVGPSGPPGPRAPFRYRTWAVGGGVVAAAVALFFGLGALGVYDVSIVISQLPDGVPAAELSLLLSSASFAIGFVIALPLSLLRAFGPGRLRDLAEESRRPGRRAWLSRLWLHPTYSFGTGYVAVIRGTPALVQVFLVYYACIFAAPRLVFLTEPIAFWAGLLALTLNTAGYQGEALRGGFQSVDRTQIESGKSIGLTPFQVFRRVTLPQALRLVTLPLANEWITNFKTSTILSYITIVELYAWARTSVAYELGRPVEAFVLLAIFYLAINVTVSRTVTYLEERWRIPGLGTLQGSFVARAG